MGASTTSLAAAAAALLLLVSVAAAADMSIVSYGEQSEEETRRMYAEWTATHGQRGYNAIISEEERRYQVFKDTLRYIDEHNAGATTNVNAGVHSVRLGLIPPTAVTGIAAHACRWCCC